MSETRQSKDDLQFTRARKAQKHLCILKAQRLWNLDELYVGCTRAFFGLPHIQYTQHTTTIAKLMCVTDFFAQSPFHIRMR